jgi:SnoaL-like protein
MVMSTSTAVNRAKAHIEAWSNHDWETSRKALADDVRVQVNTTQPIMGPVDTTGVEEYMTGLHAFADPVVAGSAHFDAAVGDDQTAMVMVTVKTDLHGKGKMDLHGARLYSFDGDGKIKHEQVIFFVTQP